MPRKTPNPAQKSSWKAWEGANVTCGASYEDGFDDSWKSCDEEMEWPDVQREWRNCRENYQAPCVGRGTALIGRPACQYGTSCYRNKPEHSERCNHPWLDDFQSKEQASLQYALEMSTVTTAEEEDEKALRLAIAASKETYKAHIAFLGSHMASAEEAILLTQTNDSITASFILAAIAPMGEQGQPKTISVKGEDDVVSKPEGSHRQVHILKVTFRRDKRRLRACWSCNDSTEEVFASIMKAVEEGFHLKMCSSNRLSYVLKYCDEDGDMCTLVERTVGDFLGTIERQSTLQLTLQEELGSLDVNRSEQKSSCESNGLLKISIATPPASPKLAYEQPAIAGTIEDDFDSGWSLVSS